ncbi:unnamed protein product [Penicillium manginii]
MATLILLLVVVKTQHIGGHALLAGRALELVAALVVVTLIDFEYFRSIRPSSVTAVYLSVTLLFETARTRTAWLLHDNPLYPSCLSTSLVIRLLLLIVQNVEKKRWLLKKTEKLSDESIGGPFNRGFFVWLNSLLRQGYTALLNGNELPHIHEKLSSQDLSKSFEAAWDNCNQNRKNALMFAIVKCLRWEILGIAMPRLAVIGFSVAQPFIVGRVVDVLQETDSLSLDMGYGLIGATAIVFIGIAVTRALYEHLGFRATTMIRGGLMALVYKHMMNLPLGSTDESSAMSLMGSDIEMLAEYFNSTVCETWANVLQLGLATWLLKTQVGAVCIAPIIIVIIFLAFSFGTGNSVSYRQKKWLEATEKRINFTSAILGSIRNVKILGLTEVMQNMIDSSRQDELEISKRFRRIQTVRVCTVAKIEGSDGIFVAQAVTSLSLINLMIFPLSSLLLAIPDTFASMGCLDRIQDFLRHSKRLDKRAYPSSALESSINDGPTSDIALSSIPSPLEIKHTVMSLKNVRFAWQPSSSNKTGINLKIDSCSTGTLVLIIGPVGSGKSTLLKGLAGETPVIEGDYFIKHPDMAFCDQKPWLINASIKDNIVGNSKLGLDNEWYRTVISACSLDTDFMKMPEGDQTEVGSQGDKLSGGQKQRITIARALYSRKRISCFDDVLSGLDNATSKLVFNRVFGSNGLLRRLGGVTFLATHSIDYMKYANFIVVLGDDGQVLEQGSPEDIRSYATDVPGPNKTDEKETNTEIDLFDDQESQHEPQESTLESLGDSSGSDKRQGGADMSIYKYYFSALGWERISFLLLFLIIDSGIGGFRYIWIELWSSSNSRGSNPDLGYWLGLYTCFSFIEAAALTLAVYWTWVVIVPVASRNLHSKVLSACMSASLSYLSNVETGSLVTRFSQDMRLVDMILPRGLINAGFQFFAALAQGAIAIASLPYLAAVIPVLLGLLFLIQRFYLRTSRQLRLLEIELKSPLYTHFIESLAGVVTIRSFSWVDKSVSRMISMLDMAQRPYYLLLCIQRWLSLVLNLVVAALTILLVGMGFALRSKINPGLLGIALVMMIDLGQVLSSLIQSWTLLETSLGAISRIKDFSEKTPCEENDVRPLIKPSPDWPNRGEIEFVDVGISYGATDEAKPVISEISLRLKAGSKVGVCGRTGR